MVLISIEVEVEHKFEVFAGILTELFGVFHERAKLFLLNKAVFILVEFLESKLGSSKIFILRVFNEDSNAHLLEFVCAAVVPDFVRDQQIIEVVSEKFRLEFTLVEKLEPIFFKEFRKFDSL